MTLLSNIGRTIVLRLVQS